MIPTFIETPRLNLLPGWKFTVEPLYSTTITPRGQNRERRNLAAEFPRHRITVQIPRDRVSDIQYLRRFWHVCRGRTVGFRVQDPSDYVSTNFGSQHDAEDPAPTFQDQPLVADDLSPGHWLFFKQYPIGEGSDELIMERILVRPVNSTLLIGNGVGAQQASDRWQIDGFGRLVKLAGFVGTPMTWGGQFDIPVRFDSELPIDVEDFRVDTVNFVLLECNPNDE